MLLVLLPFVEIRSQEVVEGEHVPLARLHREKATRHDADSVSIAAVGTDSVGRMIEEARAESDSLFADTDGNDSTSFRFVLTEDSLRKYVDFRQNTRFVPDPKKALWLAIVFPGGGQIYNRKYWKLPLVYGGFLGCVYAMTWNNTMYRDYSQAYIDIMDSDENTKSYENFLPMHYDVNANRTRLQELFKRKKNYYRRYRDLSLFCMIGVYALSIIDAYVDAEMSSFDISRDLSLRVRPALINERTALMRSPSLASASYGLQCSLNF